jgi:hypothetical protein
MNPRSKKPGPKAQDPSRSKTDYLLRSLKKDPLFECLLRKMCGKILNPNLQEPQLLGSAFEFASSLPAELDKHQLGSIARFIVAAGVLNRGDEIGENGKTLGSIVAEEVAAYRLDQKSRMAELLHDPRYQSEPFDPLKEKTRINIIGEKIPIDPINERIPADHILEYPTRPNILRDKDNSDEFAKAQALVDLFVSICDQVKRPGLSEVGTIFVATKVFARRGEFGKDGKTRESIIEEEVAAYRTDPTRMAVLDAFKGPLAGYDPQTGMPVDLKPAKAALLYPFGGPLARYNPETGMPVHVDPKPGEPGFKLEPFKGPLRGYDPQTGQVVRTDPRPGEPRFKLSPFKGPLARYGKTGKDYPRFLNNDEFFTYKKELKNFVHLPTEVALQARSILARTAQFTRPETNEFLNAIVARQHEIGTNGLTLEDVVQQEVARIKNKPK